MVTLRWWPFCTVGGVFSSCLCVLIIVVISSLENCTAHMLMCEMCKAHGVRCMYVVGHPGTLRQHPLARKSALKVRMWLLLLSMLSPTHAMRYATPRDDDIYIEKNCSRLITTTTLAIPTTRPVQPIFLALYFPSLLVQFDKLQ